MSWEDKTWIALVQRQHTPLFVSMIAPGFTQAVIAPTTGLDIGTPNFMKDGLPFKLSLDDIKAGRAHIRQQWEQAGIVPFAEFAERCLNSCQSLLDFAEQEASKDFANLSDKELSETFQAYTDKVGQHASFMVTTALMQFELEDFLKEFIAKHNASSLTNEKVEQDIKVASQRVHEVENAVELLEIATLAKEIGAESLLAESLSTVLAELPTTYPELWDKMQAYQQKFAWMGRMYYAGNPLSVADIVKRLQNLMEQDVATKLADFQLRQKVEIEAQQKAIATLSNTAAAKQLAEVVGTFLYLRMYRLDVFFMAHERLIKMFEAFSQRLQCNYEQLVYLTKDEILAGLNGSVDGFSEKANLRLQAYGALMLDGELSWFDGRTVTQADQTAKAKEQPSQLQGVVACSGEVSGKVHIVMKEADMAAMEPGSILVTTMTMPSLMLAVEKAAAIVTDEGGMLCHAAIVSRELNIPCVIATERATQVFKNGDIVNVDANKGRVELS